MFTLGFVSVVMGVGLRLCCGKSFILLNESESKVLFTCEFLLGTLVVFILPVASPAISVVSISIISAALSTLVSNM